jgi:hypothetical protein
VKHHPSASNPRDSAAHRGPATARVASLLSKKAKPWRCIVKGCGALATHGDFCEKDRARYDRVTAREWPDLSREDQKWLDATDASLARRYAVIDRRFNALADQHAEGESK